MTPKISIGLPVRNGEQYLEESVDSILAQTFTDFELIICDNASTDRTEEICRAYAAKDARIRYYRNAENIGGANNGNLTFRLAQGEYFRWAAHDDICEPTLLEECSAVLDRMPEIVLCSSRTMNIDQYGNEIPQAASTALPNLATSARPEQRFRYLASWQHSCEATYGLIRSKILRQTRLEQNYFDTDRTLLCELALRGPFYEIPAYLFRKRYHPKNQYVDFRARMAWYRPDAKGKLAMVHWMRFIGLLTAINQAPIAWRAKLRCYSTMVPWLFTNGRYMGKDLILAVMAVTRVGKKKLASSMIYNWE